MATVEQKEVLDEIVKDVKEMEGKKKDRILKGAKELVQHGMKKENVSAELCKALKGIVTDAYIRMILADEYKEKKKAHLTMKGISLEEIKKEKENNQLETAKILVTNDGKQEFEKPLSNEQRFKQLIHEKTELETSNKQKDALLTQKVPLIVDMQQKGFNAFDKAPKYFRGNAAQVKLMLYEDLKDNNPDHQYFVLVQRIGDKKIGKPATVQV
jgi:hypothetical protein